MATTTTVDISALIPSAVVRDVLEAYYAAPGLRGLAEEDRTLQGVAAGDRIKIGSFVGSTPALNLTETEEIVPKKFSASTREFIVSRIGDAYEYSYRSRNASTDDLQARATRYLGEAFAQRVDLNLASTALSSVLAGRKITVGTAGTDAGSALTTTAFIEAVRQFPDEQRASVRAILTAGQRAALTNTILAGGTQYAAQTVWQSGEIDRFFGVPIVTDTRLPVTTGARRAALFLIPNRTLVSAAAVDPLIEFERFPKKATIDAVLNAWWGGGVQDLDTLTVIDALA